MQMKKATHDFASQVAGCQVTPQGFEPWTH